MNKDSDSSKKRLIPIHENRCIWMAAGVVDYKLCDWDFNCDKCPFDASIRSGQPDKYMAYLNQSNHRKIAGKEVNSLTISEILDQFPPFLQKIKTGVYYHPNFIWVEQISPLTLKVGIDPFLVQLLGNLHAIVMPTVGMKIHRGDYFCWLFGDYPPLPILSPLEGLVSSVNREIREEPEKLISNQEIYQWLIQIKTDRFPYEVKNFKFNDSAEFWRKNQIHSLKTILESGLLNKQSNIGITLTDGGVMLTRVVDILGKRKYYEIIFQFLKRPDLKSL